MAKDDYFVIVYKILAYLYARLKKGEPVEAEMLMYDGGLFQINREYWVYIIDNMLEQGYIKGLPFTIGQIWCIVKLLQRICIEMTQTIRLPGKGQ